MTTPVSVAHLEGWTVLRVARGAAADPVLEVARGAVLPGADVVVDLHGAGPVSDSETRLVLALETLATDAGVRLVVVAAEPRLRAALAVAGIAGVHESLDEALGDVAPVRRDGPVEQPFYPAQADATLVTAEDMTGVEPHL